MTRVCRVCRQEKPIRAFAQYAPGKHRYECNPCGYERKRTTESTSHRIWAQPPLNFAGLYRRGTRCWCCRRNSAGEMLCRTCRGAA